MSGNGQEQCEFLHGLPCLGDFELPEHIDAQLPDGDLVEYGTVTSIQYHWPGDDEEYKHDFANAVLLVGGPGVLYIIGDFTTEPEGIINHKTEAE